MFNNLNFSENFKPITAGKLTARLAKSKNEIAAAQALRYQVFYNELNAVPSSRMKNRQRDFDKFDKILDEDRIYFLEQRIRDIEYDKVSDSFFLLFDPIPSIGILKLEK